MTEPGTDYERWRQAERELGAHADDVVRPIEESDEVAEAVEDETPVTGLEELAAQGRQGAATALAGTAGHDSPAKPAGHDEEAEPTERVSPERLAGHGQTTRGDSGGVGGATVAGQDAGDARRDAGDARRDAGSATRDAGDARRDAAGHDTAARDEARLVEGDGAARDGGGPGGGGDERHD